MSILFRSLFGGTLEAVVVEIIRLIFVRGLRVGISHRLINIRTTAADECRPFRRRCDFFEFVPQLQRGNFVFALSAKTLFSKTKVFQTAMQAHREEPSKVVVVSHDVKSSNVVFGNIVSIL